MFECPVHVARFKYLCDRYSCQDTSLYKFSRETMQIYVTIAVLNISGFGYNYSYFHQEKGL